MKKKIYVMAMLLAMTSGLVSGCGSAMKESASYDATYNTEAAYDYGLNDSAAVEYEESYDADMEMDEVAEETGSVTADASAGIPEIKQNPSSGNKKIIKNYHFNYDTEKFDEAYAFLKDKIVAYGGYVASSDVYGTSYRSLSLVARIPAERSDEFVSQLGTLGTVTSQSESAEDITLKYADTESRIKSLKTEQERLYALLEKAENLDSIITLENRLTEVRYELESYESQKKVYDDKVAYSTVNISLNEVKYEVEQEDDTIISRITVGLKTTFRDISQDAADFVVWLIVDLPYLIIWGIVIFVIVKIIKSIRRKRRAKKVDDSVESAERKPRKTIKEKKKKEKQDAVVQEKTEE